MKKVVIAGLFALAAVAAVTAQAETLCESEITAKLTQLKVDPASVGSIYAYEMRSREGGTTGVMGWVGLNGCRGNVVLNIGRGCRVFDVYTRGQCMVSGVSHY